MTFILSALGWLKLVPKPVWYALGIIAALLLLWQVHAGWEHAAYNRAFNAGYLKQAQATADANAKLGISNASIGRLQSALADMTAQSEARAKAYADVKASDAATIADLDKRQKADASRLDTLKALARDLPTNPQCRVPAALAANLDGL